MEGLGLWLSSRRPGVTRLSKVVSLDVTIGSFTWNVEQCFVLTMQDGRRYRAKVLIGADGNLSQVRKQLLADGLPRFAGLAIWRAMRCAPSPRMPPDIPQFPVSKPPSTLLVNLVPLLNISLVEEYCMFSQIYSDL